MAIGSEVLRLPCSRCLSPLSEESSSYTIGRNRNAVANFAHLKTLKLNRFKLAMMRDFNLEAPAVRVIEIGRQRACIFIPHNAKRSPCALVNSDIVVEEQEHVSFLDNNSRANPKSYMKERLVALRNGAGPGNGKIVFPAHFSASERRRGHEIAECLGLGHVSVGQGKDRCFTAWRLSVPERLTELTRLLDLEEEASRASFFLDQPVQSWRILQAQGIFLHKAQIVEREVASFGKERWILQSPLGEGSSDRNAPFFHRCRPGMAICLAEPDAGGSWGAANGEPLGRVAWSKGQKCCVVFDQAPSISEQVSFADLLLVPDSASFQRMRRVLRDCEESELGTSSLLHSLLGSGLKCFSRSASLSSTPEDTNSSSRADSSLSTALPSTQLLDRGLNEEQQAAVKLCTAALSGSPVVLIHGPFGTGKTRTLVEVIRQHFLAGRRVLVCAASNAAVDNMVQALLLADQSLPLARAGMASRVSTAVAAHTVEALKDERPDTGVAKKLRKEAFAMELAAEKWTRSTSGGEKRRDARKEARNLYKDIRRLERLAAAHVLRRTKILCGTLTGFATALAEGDPEDQLFDCAVIDEASQAITPSLLLLLPFLKRSESEHSGVPLVVMAGDHQQLAPTVLSGDGVEISAGLKATLFEELVERDGGGLGTRIDSLAPNDEQGESLKASILGTACALASGLQIDKDETDLAKRVRTGRISVPLCQQYRMPKQLMAFPSAAFYGGKLLSRHSNVFIFPTDEVGVLQSGSLLEVVDTAGAGFEEEKVGESLPASAKSKAFEETFSTRNTGHADLTERIVRELLSSGSYNPTDLGVVAPYSAQVMLLRQLLSDAVDRGLEIDSVDAYQGREKQVIILDTVRSNSDGSTGFLSDPHRLNVALTRSRQKLIVIGDSATLSTCLHWRLLFEWVLVCKEHYSTLGIRYQSSFELPPENG